MAATSAPCPAWQGVTFLPPLRRTVAGVFSLLDLKYGTGRWPNNCVDHMISPSCHRCSRANAAAGLQVKRESADDGWFVIRRYSDFLEFYNNLPRSFAAITPPLPPKSWRSLSFLSMTPVSQSFPQGVCRCLYCRVTMEYHHAPNLTAIAWPSLRSLLNTCSAVYCRSFWRSDELR